MPEEQKLIVKPELKISVGVVIDSNNTLIMTAKDEVTGLSPQLVAIRDVLQRAMNEVEAQLNAAMFLNLIDAYSQKKILMPGFRPTNFKDLMGK